MLSQLTVLRYVGHWEPQELDGKCSACLAQVEAVCSRFVGQGTPACGCESHEMLYAGGASSRLISPVLRKRGMTPLLVLPVSTAGLVEKLTCSAKWGTENPGGQACSDRVAILTPFPNQNYWGTGFMKDDIMATIWAGVSRASRHRHDR